MSVGDEKEFAHACLRAHNMYRDLHGCPPLILNPKLSDNASLWAKHLLKINKMQHSDHKTYGENIYMSDGRHVTGDMPVSAWYDEVEDYSFEDSVYKPTTGHFTQVIWKSSKELGVGIARKGHLTYVVTNYSPAGNYRKHFRENVPPRIKDIATVPKSKRDEELPSSTDFTIRTSNAPRHSVPLQFKEISTADRKFHIECLKAHNKYREMHRVNPLVLTEELTQHATQWAQKIADSGKLKHSGNKNFGENIYRAEGVHINGATPVHAWYETQENYDFDVAKFTADSAAFTQIIWKDTKELGVGVVRKDDITIVVASYYPPGNVRGAFALNVLRKIPTPKIVPVPKVEEVPAPVIQPPVKMELVPYVAKTVAPTPVQTIDQSIQAASFRENKGTQASYPICNCPPKKKFKIFSCCS